LDRFVVISGCSGGGKSTLLAELARRGYGTVEEPGRRIVAHELRTGGRALPWIDLAAFARSAIALARKDRARAEGMKGLIFFDRSLIDAAAALAHATGEEPAQSLRSSERYRRTIFLAPPWPEIYVTDPERRHGFGEAIAEYERLREAYRDLGYDCVVLPKAAVAERADFILASLEEAG
jgi:predicted ATPase